MDITPTPATPAAPGDDVCTSRVAPDDGPVRRLDRVSGPREPGFSVVIQRSALKAIHAHGHSDTDVEVCGVLVGRVCHDRISTYLLINAHIAGDKAASRETQVTFTADTWNAIQTTMERDHPNDKVVGWYHTHPGFGVFLSGMDLFIQDNFFNLPWQVAWVFDPVADIDGVFVWRAGKSVRAEFLIEENDGPAGHDFRAALPQSDHPQAVAARRTRRQQVGGVLLLTIVFLACFASIWYLLTWATAMGYRVRLPLER